MIVASWVIANRDIAPFVRLANPRYARQTFVPMTAIDLIPLRGRLDLPSSRIALRSIATAAIAALIAVASGCAPSALSSARQKIAAGQYAAARQELLAI